MTLCAVTTAGEPDHHRQHHHAATLGGEARC
jgi:hypothetical protein